MKRLRRSTERASLLASGLVTAALLLAPIAAMAATVGSVGGWTTSSHSLPQGLGEASAVMSNGYVYVMGGVDASGNFLSTVYSAKLNSDGSVGSWVTSPNPLPQDVSAGTAVTSNGYVYVMGGEGDLNYLSTVYSAKLNSDGSVGSWTTSSHPLPQAVVLGTSVTSNGYVYVMGGTDSSGNPLSTVYSAKLNSDGSVGSWTTSSHPLPKVLVEASAVMSNGYVYVMGGTDGSGYQPTVYSAKLNFLNHLSTTNAASSQLVALDTPTISNINSLTTLSASTTDTGYTYPLGLVDFSFSVDPGSTNQVTLTFQTDLRPSDVMARKYNTTTKTYADVPSAIIIETTLNGKAALALSYNVTDGGALDQDGTVNGTIVDPVGLATTVTTNNPKAPDTGYGTPHRSDLLALVTGAIAIVFAGGGLALLYRQKRSKSQNSPSS